MKWRSVEETQGTPARETGDRERAQKLSIWNDAIGRLGVEAPESAWQV